MIKFNDLSKEEKEWIIAELGLEDNDELMALIEEHEMLMPFRTSDDLCNYLVNDKPTVRFCIMRIQLIWLLDCRW